MSVSKTYVFKVEMSCEGCSKAISNVLSKQQGQGISKFDVDLKSQTVKVESTMTPEALLEILKKTGKKIELVEEKKS